MLGLVSASWSLAQTDIEPAKIDAFVSAAIKVSRVIDRWQAQIEAADSEAHAEQLRDQAEAEIKAAIENTENMSLNDYRIIYHAAQTDVVLAAMIGQAFQKRRDQ